MGPTGPSHEPFTLAGPRALPMTYFPLAPYPPTLLQTWLPRRLRSPAARGLHVVICLTCEVGWTGVQRIGVVQGAAGGTASAWGRGGDAGPRCGGLCVRRGCVGVCGEKKGRLCQPSSLGVAGQFLVPMGLVLGG